jgi:hypothetical protein
MMAQRGTTGKALLFNLGAGGGVGGQRHAPAALPPGKRPDTVVWVDPRAGRFSHRPGFDPRSVQPLANGYIANAVCSTYCICS